MDGMFEARACSQNSEMGSVAIYVVSAVFLPNKPDMLAHTFVHYTREGSVQHLIEELWSYGKLHAKTVHWCEMAEAALVHTLIVKGGNIFSLDDDLAFTVIARRIGA